MTQILLRTLRDAVGGVGPVNGRLKATYWAGDRPATLVSGGSVVASETFQTMFVNGKPLRNIELSPTTTSYCVKWEISFGTQSTLIRYTTIPTSSTPVEFGDLIVVDPETFEHGTEDLSLIQQISEMIKQELLDSPISPEVISDSVEDYLTANPIAAAGEEYSFLTPLATWTIPHTLGRKPSVSVFIGGEEVLTDVTASSTQVTITFPTPQVGTATLI